MHMRRDASWVDNGINTSILYIPTVHTPKRVHIVQKRGRNRKDCKFQVS
jgi:hypothetical protein